MIILEVCEDYCDKVDLTNVLDKTKECTKCLLKLVSDKESKLIPEHEESLYKSRYL